MDLNKAFTIVKAASEAAPMNKDSHVMVEQALKLIADLINEKLKESKPEQAQG